MHWQGQQLMAEEKFSDAVFVLLEADADFKECGSSLLDMVDNYALLQLDIVSCYLHLGNVDQLPGMLCCLLLLLLLSPIPMFSILHCDEFLSNTVEAGGYMGGLGTGHSCLLHPLSLISVRVVQLTGPCRHRNMRANYVLSHTRVPCKRLPLYYENPSGTAIFFIEKQVKTSSHKSHW